jgi:hypothetical protein
VNRIKDVNEFFKVLYDGAVVALFDGSDCCTVYYKLIGNNLHVSGYLDRDYKPSKLVRLDFDREIYTKYVKPEWYDNIPKQGRLCWVWDNDSIFEKYPAIILNYYTDKIYKFQTADCGYQNAKLMTSDEIKRYYA